MTPESLQELQRILLTKQPRGAVGSTTPDVGSITPMSPYEAIQAQKSQLSSDPVIANLQKFGRGIKGLLTPETPVEILSMMSPPVKGVKPVATEVLKRFDKNKFTEKGKKEFIESFKDKSKWKDEYSKEFVKRKGMTEGYSSRVQKPTTYKQSPYFIFYPDTYKSYQIGEKFDNVEQAINKVNTLKPHQFSGFTFEIRKGNPKKIKETELLYKDKT